MPVPADLAAPVHANGPFAVATRVVLKGVPPKPLGRAPLAAGGSRPEVRR